MPFTLAQVSRDAKVSGFSAAGGSSYFRMLDLVYHGPLAVALFICFLISAAEIGFVLGGEQQGWIRAALPHLEMFSGPLQHLQMPIFEASQLKVSAQLAEMEGFRGAQCLDVQGSQQPLFSSHLQELDQMFLRSILVWGCLEFFLLG